MCSTLQSGRKVLPGVFGKKHLMRLKDNPWSSGGSGVPESGYKRSEACYIPTEKKTLATYEGVWAASEVISTKAQLSLASWLPLLGWMCKRDVPSTHDAIDAMWSEWVMLVTQQTQTGNPNGLGSWKSPQTAPKMKILNCNHHQRKKRWHHTILSATTKWKVKVSSLMVPAVL